MIAELFSDLRATLAALPAGVHTRARAELVLEALSRHADFVARHPTALFQCLWNQCWWFDAPASGPEYADGTPPGAATGARLSALAEHWRAARAARGAAPFVCDHAPPAEHLGTALRGTLATHRGGIRNLAFHPTAPVFAAGAYDGVVSVTDWATGAELARLTGPKQWINGLAFGPDGRLLAAGSWDRAVRVWDWAEGALVRLLEGHTDAIVDVRFAPDGRHVVSGAADTTARLWDLDTGTARVFEGHTSAVYGVDCSPDGRLLATGSYDLTARLWDRATGTEVRRFAGHTGGLRRVRFSPRGDGTLATASYDRTVRVWHPNRDEPLTVLGGHGDGIRDLAYSRDGSRILTACSDGTARVWDADRGALVTGLSGHEGEATAVDLAPNGRWLVTGSEDGRVRMWELGTGVPQQARARHHGLFRSARFSADGRFLARGDDFGRVRVYDAALEPVAEIDTKCGRVWSLAFAPGADLLAVGAIRGPHVNVLPRCDVLLYDWRVGTEVRSWQAHRSYLSALEFAPDGRALASGAFEPEVRVWDVASGSQLAELTGHDGWVTSLAFAPDGARLAGGTVTGTVFEWSVPDRRLVGTHPGLWRAEYLYRLPVGPLEPRADGLDTAFLSAAGPVGWYPAPLTAIAMVRPNRWVAAQNAHLTHLSLESDWPPT